MDIRNLKDCFAKFATGVMIAATGSGDNSDVHGLTINSFSSVSLEPPLVLFSVGNESSNLEQFRNNSFFTLNILSADQQDLAVEFAKPANKDKFLTSQYSFSANGCPVFEGVMAYMECKIDKIIAAGDHHIIIGEVVGFNHNNSDQSPLLYFKSQFNKL